MTPTPPAEPHAIRAHNRRAWDQLVLRRNRWTIPVTSESIAAARRGEWSIVLTPRRAVPRSWFPPLAGASVLGLAAAGGQQGPILAAAGARVTVLDNSPRQLAQDREVAEREGLDLTTLEGDMADLQALADASFDLIVHPCSNCFVPDIRPVWREASRVLRPGGILLAGFINPAHFLFDETLAASGRLEVRHSLPYSDLTSLTEAERTGHLDDGDPLWFSHSLEDQIGGQLDAGLTLTAIYEDASEDHPISRFMPTFLATRTVKHVAHPSRG